MYQRFYTWLRFQLSIQYQKACEQGKMVIIEERNENIETGRNEDKIQQGQKQRFNRKTKEKARERVNQLQVKTE